MNSEYVCSSVDAAWLWSDMDSTSRLADITVQHRVSSHHQLVCMMDSHAVASWSHYHFGPNHFTKSSSEKLREAFPEKQHMLGLVWPASHRPCVDSQKFARKAWPQMARGVYLCERRVDFFFSVCGAGEVLCSCACVLHDLCRALASARCVSVSLHRLPLPLSACDCLRRPKLTGVHDVCKRKKNVRHARRRRPAEPILFLIFAHRYSVFRFFQKTHARHRNKWLESWPSMSKQVQRREPSNDGRKGNPHESCTSG